MSTANRYRLRNLALIPSWTCDIACHHCVFESSPAVKGRLSAKVAVEIVRETVSATNVEAVTVSGGEPFLDIDLLEKVRQTAHSENLKFRVVTNASFARTVAEAEVKLRQIAPLDTLGISWDTFHAQFLSAAHVSNAIRACRKLGIRVQLTCVVSAANSLQESLNLLGDDAFDLPLAQVKCLPVGRARRKIEPTSWLPPSFWETGRACRADFDTLAVIHDGTAFPCCAVGGFTEGISLGRYPDQSIGSLLERRDNDFRWRVLAASGPSLFMQYATAAELETVGASEALHDCVNCNRLFGSQLGEELVARAHADISARARKFASVGPFV